ncbi:MAG: hypothetical protein ABI555_06470 [Chloroflexota bacterium]
MRERSPALSGAGIWNASWPVQILAAAVLGALGVFMLVDPARAELFAGLVLAGYFLVDGIRYVVTRFGAKEFGRIGELESVRAGIGLLTAALLFGLSFLDAITLAGTRLILAVGAIPFGLLGLAMVLLGMGAGLRWTLAAASVVVTAYGVLLAYTQFVDEAGFATILTIVAAIALLGAAILAVRAILGARSASASAPGLDGS